MERHVFKYKTENDYKNDINNRVGKWVAYVEEFGNVYYSSTTK